MTASDLDLLQQYTRQRSEEAFAALVRRHLNLVYSAALRQVRSPPLAEEIAQSVFADLARNAHKLKPDTVLTAWLYQVTRRTAIDVIRRESRRQLREQIATEMNAMNLHADSGTGFQPVWAEIEPLLDEAMESLDETDRSAILLRYFENKSLREVGQTLRTSEDAAQKRVSRAVERLREFFSKRGTAIGSSGLVAFLSTNAVQSAPIGLSSMISAAAALSGTALHGAAALGATKSIALTTFQKTLIAAAIAAGVGTGVYETRQVSRLRNEAQTLQQQHDSLSDPVRQLGQERDEAANKLTATLLQGDKFRLDTAEISRLRGEVARLQADSQELARLRTAAARKDAADAALRAQNPAADKDYYFAKASPAPAKSGEIPPKPDYVPPVSAALMEKTNRLKQLFEQMPEKKIPELMYVSDKSWLSITARFNLNTDADIHSAMSYLRYVAKQSFGAKISGALRKFIVANNGGLPASVSELRQYINPRPDEALSGRYQLLYSGKFADVPRDAWGRMAIETAPPRDADDSKFVQVGLESVGLMDRK